MKLTLGLLAVCLVCVASAVPHPKIAAHPEAALWEQWKSIHEKSYETAVEEVTRFRIWAENLKKVEEHNAAFDLGMKTFTLEMNEFSDLTEQEFAAQRLGYIKEQGKRITIDRSAVSSAPDSQDWRTQGYVTPVKNQGQCGSCWSFSTTGSLEGQHFKATGNLVSLSEQQLVDCDKTCYGCNGGNVELAFSYLEQNGGSVLESDYPYTARDGSCKSGYAPAATVKSHVRVTSTENALKEAAGNIGPISIAIDASHYSFQAYRGGVYYEPNCSSYFLDHAVLVVGYGHDSASGMDYWLVKNSWGTGWGDNGYIKMARNRNNNCGVATDAVYPKV